MPREDVAWEQCEPEKLSQVLSTDLARGLSIEEVRRRRELHGENVLQKEEEARLIHRILRQFKSPLVFILLGAGIVTLLLREYVDSIVIFIALLINVVVGTAQEERASRAFERLQSSQERHATVIRNGRKQVIPAHDLVRGDVVLLEAGMHVPADTRILSVSNLSINESALTGEWVAVVKHAETLDRAVPISEQGNMAWMGTLVVDGSGTGVVTAIGNDTEVGHIAASLGGVDESMTPLQHGIRHLARFLIAIIVAAIAVIFALGFIRGEPLGEMLLISIALAVATMPTGLPAAVTVVLAIGMESILRRGGLVRNLLAAETLGATTVILTDKTGTLTEAKMHLASIHTVQSPDADEERRTWSADELEALRSAMLVSDGFVEEVEREREGEEPSVVVHGKPLERAILLAALDAGLSQSELSKTHPQHDFMLFSSNRRFGASLNGVPKRKQNRLYFSGTPELLLSNSTHVHANGKAEALSDAKRKRFSDIQRKKSADGYRFIAVAYRDTAERVISSDERSNPARLLEDKLVFVGLLAFEDPVRPQVSESIERVKGAGALVHVVTGDYPETARKVACDVGITCNAEDVRLGVDIEELSDDELYQELQEPKVFARTLPDQKLRIVRVLKNRGEVVAMTGDGINDAPALRSANIGVAVGSGTEVAKEASDMVLINNSFSIVVSAIEEGRKIIENLRKIVAYLLSTSFSEIFVIGSALVAGAPLPLLPGQILWANIVEEGVMSFPFAFEKPGKNLMEKNPREHSARNIVTKKLKKLIVIVSAVTGMFLAALYFWLLSTDLPIEDIRTVMFVSLSLDAMLFIFSLKSLDTPLWRINLLDNPMLLASLFISLLLLVAAVTLPPLQYLLTLTPLTAFEMLLLAGVGLFNLLTIEIAKYFIFERRRTEAV